MKLTNENSALLNNSLWSFTGAFVSKGLMFFSWVIVANILGKTINGEVGILRSTINLFITLVGTGFGLTLTKYIAKYKDRTISKTGKIISLTIFSSLFFGLIISLVYYFLTPWISVKVLRAPHLLPVLKLNTILLFLSVVNGVFLGCLEGFEKFRVISLINSIYGVVLFTSLYIGAIYGKIEGVFLGFIFSIFIALILSVYFTQKTIKQYNIKLTLKFRSELSILNHFTIPAILSGLMVVPFKWLIETILIREKNGYSEMGLFAALFLFHTLLLMLANTINAPIIISMSKINKSEKLEKLNLVLPWALGILTAVPVLFFPEILGLFFGDEYLNDDNYTYTVILIVIITVLVLFKHGMSRIMVVNNLMWFSFLSNLIWGLALITSFYFSHTKNAVTLSLSYVIAYIVNIIFIIPFYMYKKIIPKSVILSKNSTIIWVIFGILIYLSFKFSYLGILSKFILSLLFLISFGIAFYKIFKNEEKTPRI